MSKSKLRLIGITAAVLIVAAFLMGMSITATAPCGHTTPDGRPATCIAFAFISPTMVGDFYYNGSLIQFDEGGSALGVPGVFTTFNPEAAGHKVTYEVKNIKDTNDPLVGVEYGYKDIKETYTLPAPGMGLAVVLVPDMVNLSKPIVVPCDLKSYKGEAVTCGVSVNGADKGTLVPGTSATYKLPKGTYTIVITLLGDPAVTSLWSPASITKTVTVSAPSTTPTKVAASFEKSAHLIINLDKPGVVGDFFVDGNQVATQVATADQWVAGKKPHKIEVKNLTDPALGPGVWVQAAAVSVTPAPSSEKTVTIKLKGAPLDIGALIGTWSGTANTSSGGQFTITFTFTSSPACTYGGLCGSFKTAGLFTCTGKVKMLSLVNGVYTWTPANATGCSSGGGTDTLTLNPDGTLHYRFDSADGGWSDGALTKK